MKSKVVPVLLFASIVLNIIFIKKIKKIENLQQTDSIVTLSSAINKKIKKPDINVHLEDIKEDILETKKTRKDQIKNTEIKEAEFLNEDEIDKAKEAWRLGVSDFFMTNIGLTQERIDDYFQIEVDREKEISAFLQKRIDDNTTDQFFYTLEDIVEENKIHMKYLNKLKEILGTEGYEDYKAFRNQHNQRIIESGEGFFLIEI